MTIKQALNQHAESELLLSHLLKRDKAWVFANPDYKLTRAKENKFKNLAKRRAKGVPVAYLTGHKEFFGLDFVINQNVLIPRPETELLVELALQRVIHAKQRAKRVIDIGTGSGCIIVSLAKNLNKQRLQFFATDVSKRALTVARKNSMLNGVKSKVKFKHCNLLQDCNLDLSDSIIVANLPYGWGQWKNNTSAQTRGLKFEPHDALFTKQGGLYLIDKLLEQISKSESLPQTLLLEFDPRQKTKLTKLAKQYFPNAKILFYRDLAHHDRVLEIEIC